MRTVDDAALGARVRDLRRLRGMTQAQFAEKMRARGRGWRQKTVSAIESGERSLKLSEGVDLGQVLGVDVESLLNTEQSVASCAARASAAIEAAYASYGRAVDALSNLADMRAEVESARDEIHRTIGRSSVGASRKRADLAAIVQACIDASAETGVERALADGMMRHRIQQHSLREGEVVTS